MREQVLGKYWPYQLPWKQDPLHDFSYIVLCFLLSLREKIRKSNTKIKGHNNRKIVNPYLTWTFMEAADKAKRYCPHAKAFFERKFKEGNIFIDLYEAMLGKPVHKFIAVPNLNLQEANRKYFGVGDSKAAALKDCLQKIKNVPIDVIVPSEATENFLFDSTSPADSES